MGLGLVGSERRSRLRYKIRGNRETEKRHSSGSWSGFRASYWYWVVALNCSGSETGNLGVFNVALQPFDMLRELLRRVFLVWPGLRRMSHHGSGDGRRRVLKK